MSRTSLTLILILFTLSLAGCGQSGKLYMPGNPSQVTATPPGEPAEAPAGESESEENGESDDE